ncbi:MAG: ketosteroid isomerase family protein [Neisseria sp.]|nr:ketosteroid isomerase family protein [Neisseria sp.]
MNNNTLTATEIIDTVQAYYDAVDSQEPDRLADLYLDAPDSTLKFNADPAIMGVNAIREFTAGFSTALEKIKHARIEIWAMPLLGDIVPEDLEPARTHSVTVASTALPSYWFKNGADSISLPATSIFTIDVATKKFISVHNMFDIAQVYQALQG